MEKSAIIQLIRDYLGFNTGLNESVILRHMDIAQARYEGGDQTIPLPWFLMDETYTVNTVAGIQTVSLPDGFIQFDEEWSLSVTDSEGGKIELCRAPQRNVVASVAKGKPTQYVLGKAELYLYPTPDDIYTIGAPHYAVSAKLSVAPTSDWFTHFPRLVIAETLKSLALATRDESLLKMAVPMAQQEERNYLTKVETVKNNQREIVMGVVSDAL